MLLNKFSKQKILTFDSYLLSINYVFYYYLHHYPSFYSTGF